MRFISNPGMNILWGNSSTDIFLPFDVNAATGSTYTQRATADQSRNGNMVNTRCQTSSGSTGGASGGGGAGPGGGSSGASTCGFGGLGYDLDDGGGGIGGPGGTNGGGGGATGGGQNPGFLPGQCSDSSGDSAGGGGGQGTPTYDMSTTALCSCSGPTRTPNRLGCPICPQS